MLPYWTHLPGAGGAGRERTRSCKHSPWGASFKAAPSGTRARHSSPPGTGPAALRVCAQPPSEPGPAAANWTGARHRLPRPSEPRAGTWPGGGGAPGYMRPVRARGEASESYLPAAPYLAQQLVLQLLRYGLGCRRTARDLRRPFIDELLLRAGQAGSRAPGAEESQSHPAPPVHGPARDAGNQRNAGRGDQAADRSPRAAALSLPVAMRTPGRLEAQRLAAKRATALARG